MQQFHSIAVRGERIVRRKKLLETIMILACAMVTCTIAQGQLYIPPDAYGDTKAGATPLRKNGGQVLRTDGVPVDDCRYYYERTPFGLYLRNKGTASFTLAQLHHDNTTADTLYRIDMVLGATEVDPVNHGEPVHGTANYYNGTSAIEVQKAYRRAIYPEIADSIDAHFYYGSTGPRMAIVVRPGGDPADAKLTFLGQDSIKVDWQGALKIYLDEKWIELEEAVAYQVDSTDEILPVNWTASYVVDTGEVTVGFTYETYDPELPLVLQIGYTPMALGGGGDTRNMNWSTYAGGYGGDELECVEVDEEGDAYLCGYVTGSYFPIAEGYTVHTPAVPLPAGYYSAVVMKVAGATKITQWATYYGGYDGGKWNARTQAHKLAVDNTPDLDPENEVQHVFVTGSTNCTDFEGYKRPFTIFDNDTAFVQDYLGGYTRAWIAAFKKSNGVRDWATTHGQLEGTSWNEHGLAIDVDSKGQVVVGGQIERFDLTGTSVPNFPTVTPTGAFTRAVGGGFFIVFNLDYSIHWATTFGEYDPFDAYTKVTDVRITPLPAGKKLLWLTGTSSSGTATPLDVVSLPGVFFQGNAGSSPTAMIARIEMTTDHAIEYCTRWGSNYVISEAYGLHLTEKSLWVVGYAEGQELTSTECPNPGGAGVYHTAAHAGVTYGQGADGFILRFTRSPFALNYGTLIGGSRDDILLDVNSHDDSKVYITGETRSATGFSADLNPNYYHQPTYTAWNSRDALILSVADQVAPTLLWRTPFGGTASDRGWGIAASATNTFLTGATASQPFGAFPLYEFDPSSPLDLYQDWNLGGNTSAIPLVPFYQFCGAMDHEFTTFGYPESLDTQHDGFIASFGQQFDVNVHEAATPEHQLQLVPLGNGSEWAVWLPTGGPWQLQVYDAAGRCVNEAANATNRHELNLAAAASGLYVVRAANDRGEVLHGKLVKP